MRTTNRVVSENAKAFIPTSVSWNIPDDGAPYNINVPIENFSDELNFSTDIPGAGLSIVSFDKRGAILQVIVPPGTPYTSYSLSIINPDGSNSNDLKPGINDNHLNRITVSAAAFSVTGNDTTDIYEAIEAIGAPISNVREVSVNTVLSGDDDVIVATADITLTLPNTPVIGKAYKICANGFNVTINPGVGQNISGHAQLILRNMDVADIKYLITNTWLIV